MRRLLIVLVSVGLGPCQSLATSPARADEVKIVSSQLVKQEPHAEAKELQPRYLLSVVLGTPTVGLRPKDFTLATDRDGLPVAVGASKSTPFSASDEELTALILVQGTVRFMGDPDPVPRAEDPNPTPIDGYYDVVKQAIDVLGRARPRHTRLGLYVYGANVVEKVPLGPPERVTGDALGPQKAYATITTAGFRHGVDEALRILSAESGRRVLIVIGDGSDQVDGWNAQRDVERLNAASIEVYALGASPYEPSWPNQKRLQAFGKLGGYRYASQREQVAEVAATLVNDMNASYRVEFPDVQAADGAVLPFDGASHTLKIKAGPFETAEWELALPGPLPCLANLSMRCVCPGSQPTLGPPCRRDEGSGLGWLLIFPAAGALAAIGVAVTLRRRRAQDVDLAELEVAPTEPAPIVFVPPALEMPPRQTIAVRPYVDDDDGSMPNVAWIVPLAGPVAYQTFRLQNRTTIGAAKGCDVSVGDPTMSATHAEIIYTAEGYVLFDLKSRNGVTFYDKPITRHTLIDNDLFTCGTTPFKFKTTLN